VWDFAILVKEAVEAASMILFVSLAKTEIQLPLKENVLSALTLALHVDKIADVSLVKLVLISSMVPVYLNARIQLSQLMVNAPVQWEFFHRINA